MFVFSKLQPCIAGLGHLLAACIILDHDMATGISTLCYDLSLHCSLRSVFAALQVATSEYEAADFLQTFRQGVLSVTCLAEGPEYRWVQLAMTDLHDCGAPPHIECLCYRHHHHPYLLPQAQNHHPKEGKPGHVMIVSWKSRLQHVDADV